jgi:hypothetical protein
VKLQQRISETLNSQNVVAVKEARYPRAHVIQRLNQGNRCDLLLFRDSGHSQLLDADKVGYWLEIKTSGSIP